MSQRINTQPVPANISLPADSGETPFSSPLSELSDLDIPPIPRIPDYNTTSISPIPPPGTSKMSSVDSATAGSKDGPIKVGELLNDDGLNYDNWLKANKVQMRLKGVWNIASGAEVRPPSGSSASDIADWDRRDNLAIAQLALNMPLSLIGQLNIDSAHQLYSDLNSRFAKTAEIRVVLTARTLREKTIQPTQTMADHINDLRKARIEYLNSGGELSNKEWRLIILLSLGSGYWGRYAANFTGVPDTEQVITTLLFEEKRIGAERILELAQAEASATAFLASRLSSRISSSNNAGGSRSNTSPQKVRTQCHNCGARGHIKANCFAPGGGKQDSAPAWYKVPPHMAHLVAQTNSSTPTPASSALQEAALNVLHFSLMANIETGLHDSWILDSGASSSMCNDRLQFSSLMMFDSPQPITTAKAGHSIQATGKGSIRVSFKLDNNLSVVTFNDVLYVPDLDSNLLSVGKLMDSNVTVSFTKDRCTFARMGTPFGIATRVGSLYQVQMMPHHDTALIVSAAKDVTQNLPLWHRRLAHINERRVLEMFKNGAVNGLLINDETSPGRCIPCIVGKHTATPSPSTGKRASYPFEVIHSDIQFFDVAGLGGFKYALCFVDEFSGYMWQIPLKEKTGATVLAELKRIDTHIEVQFKRRIRSLHSDNGGEYSNKDMDSYLKYRGINHLLIAPHRHEMNGLAERANRSSADCIRSMLEDSKRPKSFWPYALLYYADIRNFTTNSSTDSSTTPYEIVHGSKPDISHLRVFGCDAYIRVPPDTCKKLDAKSVKGIFVGLASSAAYNILLPNWTLHKSKDVIFFEDSVLRTAPIQSQMPPDNTTEVTEDRFNPAHSTLTLSTSQDSLPLALRKPKRSEHLKDAYNQSREQETTYAYMDNPEKAYGAMPNRRSIQGHLIPLTIKEALAGPDSTEWIKAGLHEINMLLQHDVWDEVPRPSDNHIIRGKWVFNIKDEPDGLVFRARWVARGDFQLEDEYGELHASSGDFNVARILLAITVQDGSTLGAIDINSAYLHSDLVLASPIYVEYPTGFSPSSPGNVVCRLKRALYGLKQGARAWQDKFSSTLAMHNFKPLVSAPSTYWRSDAQGETLLATHVDDLLNKSKSLSGSAQSEHLRFLSEIGSHFKFSKKDLGSGARILGWDLHHDTKTNVIRLGVKKKILRMAEKYGLLEAKTAPTPMAENALSLFDKDDGNAHEDPPFPFSSLIGELLWLAMNARPDIAFAVQVLSRSLKNPKDCHWTAAKRVVRYLLGTSELALQYSSQASDKPICYTDADWARDPSDRKSMSGYVFLLAGAAVIWKVKRQTIVALSTAEAEYIAASYATREAIWFRSFFAEIGRSFKSDPLKILVDNQAAIKMAANPVYLSKTKHIDIAVHHIRDEFKAGRVAFSYVPGTDNVADIFTKPLPPSLHSKCVSALGLL